MKSLTEGVLCISFNFCHDMRQIGEWLYHLTGILCVARCDITSTKRTQRARRARWYNTFLLSFQHSKLFFLPVFFFFCINTFIFLFYLHLKPIKKNKIEKKNDNKHRKTVEIAQKTVRSAHVYQARIICILMQKNCISPSYFAHMAQSSYSAPSAPERRAGALASLLACPPLAPTALPLASFNRPLTCFFFVLLVW